MAHHPALKAYKDCGLGHQLECLKSQVLVNVLIRCAKGEVAALPIYDCIIVPRSQMAELIVDTSRSGSHIRLFQ